MKKAGGQNFDSKDLSGKDRHLPDKTGSRNIPGWLLWLLQAAGSVLFFVLLAKSRLLPVKYLGPAAVLIVVLLVLTFLFARAKRGAARSAGLILSIFVCGLLTFGFVYLHQIDQTISNISDSLEQTDVIVVVVRDTDAAMSAEDLSGYAFGSYAGATEEYVNETIADVAGQVEAQSLDAVSYDSPLRMAQDLLDGKVDALIYNQAYTSLLDDLISGYSADVRVVYQTEFVIDVGEETEEEAGTEAAADAEAVSESADAADSGARDLTQNSFHVLISGIDVSGPISTTSRSDVNIIMTVNPKTHQILLSTTPRDYFVFIPGISGDQRDKLTHAGIYGVTASMQTLDNLYGIEIDYYVRINFDSLVGLVDALGGVDVNSEYDFTTSSGYHFTEGINHLDGEAALSFSRERYAFADGDNQRGKDQMLVLTAILEKLQSPAVLQNPGEVLSVISESMQTNVSKTQITDFISFQLANGGSWDIERQAVTGAGGSEETYSMPGTLLYVMWPDEELVEQASAKMQEIYEGN